MTFQEINDKIVSLAAQKGGQGVSFKFAFPTGIIVVTGEGQVTNENLDTDCTIATSEETFTAILNGLFTDTELAKDIFQQVIVRYLACYFTQMM